MIFILAPLALSAIGLPSVAVPAQTSLLGALPPATFAAIHLPSPKAVMAARETNHWVAFATNAKWETAFGHMAAFEDDITQENVSAWWRLAMGTLADSTSAVAFAYLVDPSEADPSVLGIGGGADAEPAPSVGLGLIARGGPETATLLRRFVGPDARADTLPGGQEVWISNLDRANLYFEHNGLVVVLSAPTLSGCKEAAENCFASVGDAELGGPFALPEIARFRRPGAAMELALDARRLWEVATRTLGRQWDPPTAQLMKSLSSVNWMYGAFELGVGEASNWNLYLPYGQDNWLGGALSFFGEADKGLLATAPKSAVSATVGAFDIVGFTAWALEILHDESEEVHAQALAGFQAAKSAVGVDVLDDVVGNMTGHFLVFSGAPTAGDAESQLGMSSVGQTTLVAMMDETDPILDLVEALLEMSGMGEIVTTETVELANAGTELELYKTDESMGVSAAVAIGSGRVVLSSDLNTLEPYIALLKSADTAQSIMAHKKLQAALAAASGAIITIQPTASGADVIQGIAEMMAAMTLDNLGEDIWDEEEQDDEFEAEVEAEIDEAFDTGARSLNEIADLWRLYFSGTTTSEVKIQDGLIHLRTLTR